METKELISCIVCHHRGDLVFKAIGSIFQSKSVKFEVILVTSVPNFLFDHPGVRVVFQEGGPALKRNIGSQFASGDLLAFFDDDVEIDPYCLFEMERQLVKERIGMVFGKTLNMEFRNRFDEAGSFLTWTGFLWARGDRVEDRGQFETVEPILAGKSASCMVKRRVFLEVGQFDASYEILAEETDLAWRIWLKGYQVLWCPQSVAYHAFNTRFKPVDFYTHSRIYSNGCRNYMSMLFTNLGRNQMVFTIPVHFSAWLVAGVSQILAGKVKAGAYIFRGIADFFSRLGDLIQKRRLIQSTRMIHDRELFRIILKSPPLSYYVKRLIRYVRVGLHG